MLNISTCRPLRTCTASVSGYVCRTSTRLRHAAFLTNLRQASRARAIGGCSRPAAVKNASLMRHTKTICIHSLDLSNAKTNFPTRARRAHHHRVGLCRMSNKFYQPGEQRAAKVADLFAAIAPRYDLINDLQSLGLHRRWKRLLLNMAEIKPGDRALDLCCGTGDIAFALQADGADVVRSPF